MKAFHFVAKHQVPTLLTCGFAVLTLTTLAAAQDVRASNQTNAPIHFAQLSAKAGADYHGDGLAVSCTAEGARLRCVFQRLEGEATREGLWLTSTVTNAVNDRFRVMAA